MLDKKKKSIFDENDDVEKDFKHVGDGTRIHQSKDGIIIDEEKETEINLGEGIAEDIEEAKQIEKNKATEKKETVAKKNDNYKYFIYLFVILAITAFVLWFNLSSKTGMVDESGKPIYVYQTIGTVFKSMNVGFFVLFLAMILLDKCVYSLIIFIYARLYTKHYKYHQALANNAIGGFYSAITPGASGGQFAQIITFKKQGIPVSNSASIFVMSFIISQSCLIFMGILSLATNFEALFNLNMIPISIGDLNFSIPIWIFIIFGFVVNLLVIFLLLFMSYSKGFSRFISVTMVNFLGRIKILKNPEQKSKDLKIQVENYRIELRRLQSNIPFFIVITLLSLTALVLSQLAPFFSGLALNAYDVSDINWFDKMFDCVTFMNFHQMVTGLIPLPGSAGISEMVFGALFGTSSSFFSEEFYVKGGLNILLLVWRFGTFYIPFIINGIVAATYKTRGIPVQERIVPVANKHTLLTIQLETYDDRKASSDTMYETKILERKELLDKFKIYDKKKKKNASVSEETLKKDDEIESLVIGGEDESSDI